MHFKHLHTAFALVAIGLLASCHSKVDFTDINKQADLEMGLAFPVGTMCVTIGDLLHAGDFNLIYVDDSAVFHLLDTVDLNPKTYHKINLDEYVLQTSSATPLGVKAANGGKSTLEGDGSTVIPLSFDMALSTSMFNKDPNDERVDSIWVARASISSVIKLKEMDIKPSEIQKVEVELGSQFYRKNTKKFTIPFSDYGFGTPIPAEVDNFSFCLMKDTHYPKDGSVDNVDVHVTIHIRPESDHIIKLTDNSSFVYDMQLKVDQYDAIWGFFAPGKEMQDEDITDMNEEWEEWKNIKKIKVRFKEPTFEVYYSHKVAAPLVMNISYVETQNAQGEKVSAEWGKGNTSTSFIMENKLNPEPKTLGDSVYNTRRFTSHPDSGHVDLLFNVRPDYFKYKYWMSVDEKADWRQFRLERDLMVRGYAIGDIPFKIDTLSELEYSTTLEDVNISSISLDSIVESTEILDSVRTSDVKLILEIQNGLPFKFTGQFAFLDANRNKINLKLVDENDNNQLILAAPKMERANNEKYGKIVAPSITRYTVTVGKNDFKRLSEVKFIQMDVAMIDNPKPCKITTKDYLKVFIGVAAHVDAVMDFDKASSNDK